MSHRVSAAAAAAVLLGASTLAWSLTTPAGDEEAVRATLEHYLQGHATGDGAHMAIAFHPDAELMWVQDGRLRRRSVEDYIAGFPGRPAPDEARRARRIVQIDVDGSAASAKILLDYPDARFVDYMSLLKVDGEWKIVHKIFHREPKEG